MAHNLVEEIRVSGSELIDRVKEILKEGNVRRLIIKDGSGKTLLKLPLTFGVIGVGSAFALAPVLSSIATFAFFARDARIIVERYPQNDLQAIDNELSRKTESYRPGHSTGYKADPYEIDSDFEIIDP